jgi:PPM family protein phosphatase
MEQLQAITELNSGHGSHEGMSGKHNEDNFGLFSWQLDDGRVLHVGVVADGVGGQIAGELASRLAVDAVEEYFRRQVSTISNISGHLERAILAANRAVYEHGREKPELQGMGTTMVVAAVLSGRLYTACVGDSRIYLLRDGRLQQVTVDHTWAQEAIEAGLLTREQARVHPNRNVIKRFLGGLPEVEVDHRLVTEKEQIGAETRQNQGLRLKPGDTLLLCSDGLSDMIDDHAIWTTLHEHFYNLPAAVAELIDKANAAGGRDNITVVLLQVPGGRPVAAAAPVAAVPATAGATVPVREPAQNVMGRWGVPLLLAGGALLGLLAVGSLVGLFLVGRVNGRAVATPALTNGTPLLEVENTPLPLIGETPEGPPATAAIIVPVVTRVTDTPQPEASPVDTPALIPTLQATQTPRPPPTARPSPTATATATVAATAPSASPPGDSSGLPGPPPATEPPPAPTETPATTVDPNA